MNDQGGKIPTPDDVRTARAEASVWISRLHGADRTPEMEAGFRRWLAERDENAREFEGLTDVWELLPATDTRRAGRGFEQWGSSAPPPRRRWRPALAVTACLVLFAAILQVHRLWPDTGYATSIGEQRTIRLDDGSRISLNSGSRATVDYASHERRIHLIQGEAMFEVAKDAARPFIVQAGAHSVTALGTSFLIRRQDEQIAVTLIEGSVVVSSPPSSGMNGEKPTQTRERLIPGQRLTTSPHAPPALDTPRLEMVTAWRRGEVVLEEMRLADAISEMNRYDRNTIIIDDMGIGSLTVSGLYHTGDSLGFARSVAIMHGLHVVEDGQSIRLRK